MGLEQEDNLKSCLLALCLILAVTATTVTGNTSQELPDVGSNESGTVAVDGKLHMLYTCCALSAPVILLFAYWPLMSKLHNSASRLDEVQAELLNHRSAIAVLDNSNVEGELIRQDDISLAIAELTEKGRSLGLQFSSIAQLPLQKTTQAGIAMLPISFTIESEYKTAGQFLAHIEDSPCGITKVESLSIRPKEVDQSELSVELMLNLYVEIENET